MVKPNYETNNFHDSFGIVNWIYENRNNYFQAFPKPLFQKKTLNAQIFFDFSIAYNSVNNELWLGKLARLDFSNMALELIALYLSKAVIGISS